MKPRALLIIILLISGCTEGRVTKTTPFEFGREEACTVCGMIVVDYPGPKAQIHYENGMIDPFCCTLDLFTFFLQPGRPGQIKAIYVNDMAKADWKKPEGHWIDARKAYYVYGGDVMVAMGEALVPFSERKDAEFYQKDHGGRIVGFDDVTMEMLRPK